MPQRILGIDIGSYSVKVAELSRSFRFFEFIAFYERRIATNELLSRDELAALALQGLIDDNKLHFDAVCVGFPSQQVSSRLLTFPFGSRKKIDQAIGFEIENYVPFKMEEIMYDYALIWSTKEASRVMALYAHKKDIAQRISLLQGIGIDPQHICVEGVEMMNLVNLGMVPPEGAFAIIDIGHEKTTVSIFNGRRFGYMRSISIAGRAMTEAIAKKLQIPIDEAEKFKIEMGQIPLVEGEVIDDLTKNVVFAIREVMSELLLHLRQTLFSYRETEETPIEGIYLCGGSSRLIGIDSYISDFLKQNVTFLNCAEFHFSRLERAEAHRHVIPQALSLALKEVSGHVQMDVDFRKGEFAFRGNVEQLGGGLRRAFIIIGLIVFLGLLNFSLKYYTLKQKLDKISEDATSLVLQVLPNVPKRTITSTSSALSVLKGKQAEINEKTTALKSALGFSPFDMLKEISELMPSREEVTIDIKEMNIAPDRVAFAGQTNSFENVDKIKLAMEKSDKFKNVTTGNVRKGVKGEVKFDLSMETESSSDSSKDNLKEPPKETTKKADKVSSQ